MAQNLTIELLRRDKKDKIIEVANKYGAHNIRVFGSVVRGEAKTESDIDLIVEFDNGRSLLDHIGLIQDLESVLNRKVEVVTEKSLHWYLKDRILKEAISL